MAFERTRDILDKAREFHREIAAYYERLDNVAQKERVRMLLEYLRRHEQTLDEELKSYEAGASKAVLDVWFQYAPEDVHAALATLRIQPDLSVEEVVDLAMQMDARLLELYRHAAELAPAADVRELFAHLHSEGLHERARLLQGISESD